MNRCSPRGVLIVLASALLVHVNVCTAAEDAAAGSCENITAVEATECHIRQGQAAERIYLSNEALGHYEEALLGIRASGQLHRESWVFRRMGNIHIDAGWYSKALEEHQQALKIDRDLHDRKDEGEDLRNVGRVYYAIGQFARGLEQQKAALRTHREIGERQGEAEDLREIGNVYNASGEYFKALAYYRQSLRIDREIGYRKGQSDNLANLGTIYLALGRYTRALQQLRLALSNDRRISYQKGEAADLINVGRVLHSQGRYEEALARYQQALRVDREIGYRAGEADDLSAVGVSYYALGQFDRAFEQFEQALKIEREIGNRNGESASLGNIGNFYYAKAQYAQALEQYDQVVKIDRETGSRLGEAAALGNIGSVYGALGQYASALERYTEALRIDREVGSRYGAAAMLANIGNLYIALHRYPEALEQYREAFNIDREIGARKGEAAALAGTGSVYQALGQHDKALQQLRKALGIQRRIGNRNGEGVDLVDIGIVEEAIGQHAEALGQFRRALPVVDEVGAPETQWRVRAGLSISFAALHRVQEAIFWGKQAINLTQTMRQSASTLDRVLQRSFLEDKRSVYQGLSNLLIDSGRLPEAEFVLGMLKEEEYFDFIQRAAPNDPKRGIAPCDRVEIPWCQRYTQIENQLAAKGSEYAELVRIVPEERTPLQQTRYRELQADLAVARQEYAEFLKALEADFAKASSDRSVIETTNDVLKSLRAEQGDLKLMGHGAVIVHYLITPQRLRILVTTPDIQLHRDADVSEVELNHRIAEFRLALQSSRSDPVPAAQYLYQALILPIQQDLEQAAAHTLMVSLPGALRYIPLGALYDGNAKQWVAERFSVVLYTEAARSHLTEEPQRKWQVAALGMSKAAPPFPALEGVPAELDGIVNDAQRHSHGVLPGVERLDENFTAAELTSLLEAGQSDPNKRYAVVHIASHFSFSTGDDGDREGGSFLLLGDKTHLSLTAFATGAYPLQGVDLLTLSACDTALGSGDKDGREVDGLAAVAQNDGARSVIATLWSVADASTGIFMKRFYAVHEEQRLTKAEALREVQLAFIRGDVNSATLTEANRGIVVTPAPTTSVTSPSSSVAPYSHPYFWAPFVLMGNWL